MSKVERVMATGKTELFKRSRRAVPSQTAIPERMPTLKVLLVEDNEDDRVFVQELLETSPICTFQVEAVGRLRAAIAAMERHRYDVVLLDLSLPDARGLDTVERAAGTGTDVPLVVMTGLSDEELALASLQLGVQDYLVKGELNARLLSRTLMHAVERQGLRLELKRAKERAHRLATHDSLTGLPNRQLLFDRLHQAIAHASRYQERLAVLFVDLDRFKPFNDGRGHHAGDRFLREMARRLARCVRKSDTVARLGGDEFVVFLPNTGEIRDAARVATGVLRALARPYVTDDGEAHSSSASIGVSRYPHDGTTPEALIERADGAMYRAKRAGGGQYRFCSGGLDANTAREIVLEATFPDVFQKRQLSVYYQPQVDAVSGRIVGVEALARWQHPELGTLLPGEFLPLAEKSSLMGQVGKWVLREACSQWAAWRSEGVAPLRLAVNLSQQELRQPDLREILEEARAKAQIPADHFEVDVAESSVSKRLELFGRTLADIKHSGVRLALDNFGAGPLSLRLLADVPFDIVKLDRSFVRRVGQSPRESQLIASVLGLVSQVGLDSLAEGVETREQVRFLSARRCRSLQGNHFGPPRPAEELLSILKRGSVSL